MSAARPIDLSTELAEQEALLAAADGYRASGRRATWVSLAAFGTLAALAALGDPSFGVACLLGLMTGLAVVRALWAYAQAEAAEAALRAQRAGFRGALGRC